ncbi:MAG: hypothetical protein J6V91_06500, partial [Kiritimatiellae bacterium]|nr:hypothetical protein [Kiritimatiellia bacterium]
MFDTLLLAIGSTSPIKAFVDSDMVGQFIVIAQILMSISSWGMMLGKKLKLDEVRMRSAHFVDTFVKKN